MKSFVYRRIWIQLFLFCRGRALRVRQDLLAAEQFSFGTASTGGTWYIVGAGLASHANNQLSDLKITAEVTQGAIENYNLIKRGKLDLAITKPDILSDDITQKLFGGGAKDKITQFLGPP